MTPARLCTSRRAALQSPAEPLQALEALHTTEPARRLHPVPACLARHLTAAPARRRALPAHLESGSGSQYSTARCAPRLQAAQPGQHRRIGAPAAQPLRCRRAQPTWRAHSAVQSRTCMILFCHAARCARRHGGGAPALLCHSGVVARGRAPPAPAPATLRAELGPGQVLLCETALHRRGVWAGMPLGARKAALQSAALSTVPQEAVRSWRKEAQCLGWASTADGHQAHSIPCSHGAGNAASAPTCSTQTATPDKQLVDGDAQHSVAVVRGVVRHPRMLNYTFGSAASGP